MSVETSVIICSYNNDKYLARAIRSCLKQSLPRESYEVIVVDDASTDSSRDIIASFGDQIMPVRLMENVGVAEASNIGIKAAIGKYVIRVDSDDYINENTLLFLSEVLNWNQDIGFVYSDHLRVNASEQVIERVNLSTLDLLFRHGAGILFRKSYLEQIGLYDPALRNAEDYHLLKRYIKNWDGFHLKLPLYRYRQLDTSLTHKVGEREKWEALADEKHLQH